jgi:DNA-3-methyladenine glycosylase II
VNSTVLDEANFAQGLGVLAQRDADLAKIIERLGPPPLDVRQPGFPSLVHIILEQQVSVASAQAAFDRLYALANPPTPQRFLEMTDPELRQIGFSRQKIAYCRGLAEAIQAGSLDLDNLNDLEDASARHTLLQIKGIGTWTADIYLLMALRRPDIWPAGDLALIAAVQRAKRLPERPNSGTMQAIAEDWRPWRAVAAQILWHDYLNPEG